MTTTNDSIKTLKAATTAAKTLTDTERTLREQHALLVKERSSTASAHRSADECVQSMEGLVDEAGAAFVKDWGSSIATAFSGDSELSVTGTKLLPRKPKIAAVGSEGMGRTLTLSDLCALAPSVMKPRLAQIIRSSGSRFGLPAAERASKLAELDQAITDLETQHTELVDAAAEVGISLQYLPSVRERRETEARKLAREVELAAQREAGIFEVRA